MLQGLAEHTRTQQHLSKVEPNAVRIVSCRRGSTIYRFGLILRFLIESNNSTIAHEWKKIDSIEISAAMTTTAHEVISPKNGCSAGFQCARARAISSSHSHLSWLRNALNYAHDSRTPLINWRERLKWATERMRPAS